MSVERICPHGDEVGKENKKSHAENNGKHHSYSHNDVHELISANLAKPFFKFCFVFSFVNSQHIHTVAEGAVAEFQHFNHIDATAKQRNICPFVLFAN